MKTVCHLTSVHQPNDVRIFHKECSSLAKSGFNVFIVATNCVSEIKNGVNIAGVNTIYGNRFSRIFFTSRKVYKKGLSINAAIYHIHDPELLPFALKLKRKGKKVIYDVHEDVPKQIMSKYWINKFFRTFLSVTFRWYEDYVAKRLDHIITATPYIRNRFIQLNTNCTDINNFPLLSEVLTDSDWATKKNEICYTGGISAIRGIDILIDALDTVEGVRLNLAGSYSEDSYRETLKTKASWNRVNEYGFVDRKEVASIMGKSKAGVVTFLPEPNHINAQPNKLFEYMSAGIPVIASDFPLWKEIIKTTDCGICVDPESATEIANAIRQLTTCNDRAKQMGDNGRKAVQSKYNWSIEEKKLIAIYNSL